MSVVGSFPGLNESNRRTIRAPTNPMDKCTIVSIFPKEINEIKHTIQPGRFHINAGSYEAPALLIVGSSSWWREIDENQPLLEIPNSSIQVADSVVKDFCNGLLACNMSDVMPGLFYVNGESNLVEIKTTYKDKLNNARANQKRWYEALVQMADINWARSNGNPLSVGDDMRLAARELALNSKDWMRNTQSFEMIRCVACGALRNPSYPVCGACHAVIDKDKAEKLGLTFLQ